MANFITTLDYALMANRVYNIDNSAAGADASGGQGWSVGSFDNGLFKEGMSWGATNTDFKGCVYASGAMKRVVVAFQGTKPSKGGDLLADVQILIGMLPQYCNAAKRLLDAAEGAYPGHAISFVGHSLGGGMAQVMGHWTGYPFVTFNAPGMWGDIQHSKVGALWSSVNGQRSMKGASIGPALAKMSAATGRNFRNVLDPVSAYGMHYGPVTRFWGRGLHSMDDLQRRIETSAWRDKDPLDAANKEWGEL